ncbi:MAG TPA: hypothetical protein VK841_13770 [Polyangiaceae bacterium]|jgi:hypothetical protein|nr:hypothetical protein [Polyangiaceae bacterium]
MGRDVSMGDNGEATFVLVHELTDPKRAIAGVEHPIQVPYEPFPVPLKSLSSESPHFGDSPLLGLACLRIALAPADIGGPFDGHDCASEEVVQPPYRGVAP